MSQSHMDAVGMTIEFKSQQTMTAWVKRKNKQRESAGNLTSFSHMTNLDKFFVHKNYKNK